MPNKMSLSLDHNPKIYDYEEALKVARHNMERQVYKDVFYFDQQKGKGMFTVSPIGIINRSRR